MSKEAAKFASILKGWGPSLQRAVAKMSRWPAGSPGSKGGQFAPAKLGGAAPFSTSKLGFQPKQLSLFSGVQEGVKAPQYGIGKPLQAGPTKWLEPGEPYVPKPPPPGAKPHLKTDDYGKPVTINYPTKPSDPGTWKDANSTATFVPGGAAPASLNGVAMKPWADAPKRLHEWANVEGQKPELDRDFPMEPKPGKSVGAGVIVVEPDGRMWLTKPTNHFGGYLQTFPKGTVENGLSLQASAIKEAYEETGLKVRITGVLGDYERTTSVARFYIAQRVGGTPADMGWESQAIRLAAPRDLGKLLNNQIDKDILEDYRFEHFLKRAPLSLVRNHEEIEEETARRGLAWLYKAGAKPEAKGGHWQHQARWPAGTPLGGQWKTMGADGLTMPPTIAGGLTSKNPAYQKKANAVHALAQAGDFKKVIDQAVMLEKTVQAATAAGQKSSHVKWNAQLAQYAAQLVQDAASGLKAEASAAKLSGPEKLSDFKKVGEKPGGSNDGAIYADANGTKWLVKGNNYASTGGLAMSDDRAKNEVLASKLMAAAGIPGPEIKLVDLEGKHQGNLGVAVKWIDGLQKFNALDAGQLAAVQNQFAVHAWLGNWDVLGMHLDNTMFKDGKAINIDPGGSILFRAQGAPKSAGAFDASASDWASMRSTDKHQKSIYGSMTSSQLEESAKQLAGVTDDMIAKLVSDHGPGGVKEKSELTEKLIARRDNIMLKAGLTVKMKMAPLADPQPAPAPEPPKIVDAVPAPVNTSLPEKPVFNSGTPADKYYVDMADKAAALHQAGDLAGLKAMYNAKKVQTWAGTSKNSAQWVGYYNSLVSDLEGKHQTAVNAVAEGKATVTDAKGQEWKADNGVLNPVGSTTATNTPSLTSGKIVDLAMASYKWPTGMAAASVMDAMTQSGGSLFQQMVQAATKGDLAALQAVSTPITATGKKFKTKLINALKAEIAAAGGDPAKPQIRPPKPAVAPEPVPMDGLKVMAAGAQINGKKLSTLEMNDALTSVNPILSYGSVMLNPGKSTKNMAAMLGMAANGDLTGLANIKANNEGESKLQIALANAMMGMNEAQPAPEPPPALAPAPKPALPDFEKEKLPLTNTNAGPHNGKVDQIKALAEKGYVAAILSLKFGTNTYAKKQVALANDVLAALGSPHKVALGQKQNSHPGVIGSTGQPSTPAAPAVAAANAAQAAAPAGPDGKKRTLADLTPDKLPPIPDVMNYKGPGSPYSSKQWKNDANKEALQAVFNAALAGGMPAVDQLKFPALNPDTGTPTGAMLTISEHPAKQLIGVYVQDVANSINDFLNPPKPMHAFNPVNASSVKDAAASFLGAKIGMTVNAQPKDQQFGQWLSLGNVTNKAAVAPDKVRDMTDAEYKAGKTAYSKYSSLTKQWIKHVQSSGTINRAIDDGKETYGGLNLKEVTKAIYNDATEFPAGSTIYRWQNMPPGMVKQIESAPEGLVFQSLGGFCASKSATGTSHFGPHQITIRMAPGAKAIHSHGSGAYASEQEITTIPGQRYVLLSKSKVGKNWRLELLALPPDENFVK